MRFICIAIFFYVLRGNLFLQYFTRSVINPISVSQTENNNRTIFIVNDSDNKRMLIIPLVSSDFLQAPKNARDFNNRTNLIHLTRQKSKDLENTINFVNSLHSEINVLVARACRALKNSLKILLREPLSSFSILRISRVNKPQAPSTHAHPPAHATWSPPPPPPPPTASRPPVTSGSGESEEIWPQGIGRQAVYALRKHGVNVFRVFRGL